MTTQVSQTYEGRIIDLENETIFEGRITVEGGIIKAVEHASVASSSYLLPGLIDAHVHVESSMLVPSEFARLAVVHGTVGTVSDPHEIGNVLGVEGVRYMLQNGSQTNFKFCFGAPSCVPATTFETAGASIDVAGVTELLETPGIGYLAEVMNFPGVLARDQSVMAKIEAAHRLKKPVDGHAPGLRGEQASHYAAAGMSTDHECSTAAEARDKIACGMKILVREGSAAKNFDALIDLIAEHPDSIMFCSDDKHPDSLLEGHINQLVKRAIARGHSVMKVLRAASLNPIKHYGLDVGLLRVGDPADFIVVDNLESFNVTRTFIRGECVAQGGKTLLPSVQARTVNNFNCTSVTTDDIRIEAKGARVRTISIIPGELISKQVILEPRIEHGCALPDIQKDLLKIVVLNRYQPGVAPAVGFVHNFGLKTGALASTVAHDSHNIVAVGTNDADIVRAINLLVEAKGGISLANAEQVGSLPLPVAGLMSLRDGYEVAALYTALDEQARALGTTLPAPFMTLSFLALLVIPELKLSDKGLFDGTAFQFVNPFL